MTKEELVSKLELIVKLEGDPEAAHSEADDALLTYINDANVINAYDAIKKWYA